MRAGAGVGSGMNGSGAKVRLLLKGMPSQYQRHR